MQHVKNNSFQQFITPNAKSLLLIQELDMFLLIAATHNRPNRRNLVNFEPLAVLRISKLLFDAWTSGFKEPRILHVDFHHCSFLA